MTQTDGSARLKGKTQVKHIRTTEGKHQEGPLTRTHKEDRKFRIKQEVE